MDKQTLRKLSERYREAIIQRVWDQWIAIGGVGDSSQPRKVTWAVDPEALLLVSTNFFRNEPRMREVALAWILRQGELLSLSRIKRMQNEFGFGDDPEISRLAESILSLNPSMRTWRGFLRKDRDLERVRICDNIRRETALEFNPNESACLVLKLRSLLGVNSRVEILFSLYHSARSDVSSIASDMVWNKKTIQRTLNEMVLSGHVFSDRKGWPKTVYWIRNDEWAAFFPTKNYRDRDTIWLGQQFLYRGIVSCLATLQECIQSQVPELAANFLIVESFSEAYYQHQRACEYLTRESYSEETVEGMVERLVENAESSDRWPVGAFEINPNRTKFV